MSFQEYWAKVPQTWKYEAQSIVHTFIAAVVIELSIQLSAGGGIFPTGKDALLALAAALLRSGVKAVINFAVSQVKSKDV